MHFPGRGAYTPYARVCLRRCMLRTKMATKHDCPALFFVSFDGEHSTAPFSVNLRPRGTINSSRVNYWSVRRDRSTSVEQSTASPPLKSSSKSFSSFKKELKSFFWTVTFLLKRTLTVFSAFATVRTVKLRYNYKLS